MRCPSWRALGRLGVTLAGAWAAAAGAVAAEGGRAADRFDSVVIDAGHGGRDVGARGGRGLVEKDVVLDVSRRLAKRLQHGGLRVVLTRDSDRFVSLEERTSIANDARSDLFISIHANSAPNPKPRGIETYFLSLKASDDAAREVALRENESFDADAAALLQADPVLAILGDMAANDYMKESDEFARLAQAELAHAGSTPSRGVKQAHFVVLRLVQMPSSLIEIGFLSNATDERSLRRSESRDAIADALARAVLQFGKRYDARRGVVGRKVGNASIARSEP